VAGEHYQKYGKKWYEANRERELNRNKTYYQMAGKQKKLESYLERRERILKSRYNMTLADYDKIHAEQDGRCAICYQKQTTTMHIDHCHLTGKVRALLCGSCNRGLGYFQDDANILLAASDYLTKHSIKSPDMAVVVEFKKEE
jgi:hypothetical protein